MTIPEERSAEAQAVLNAEQARCDAMAVADLAGIEALLHRSLTYVHLTGQFQRRAEYLEHMRSTFERNGCGTPLTRSDLEVRVFGDAAILTGGLYNHRGDARSPKRVVLQTWVKEHGTWLLAAHQTTADNYNE